MAFAIFAAGALFLPAFLAERYIFANAWDSAHARKLAIVFSASISLVAATGQMLGAMIRGTVML